MEETQKAARFDTTISGNPEQPFRYTMDEADSRLARAEEEARKVPLQSLNVKDLLNIVDARTKRRTAKGGTGLAEKLIEAEVLETIIQEHQQVCADSHR